jgi:hypothetical protein
MYVKQKRKMQETFTQLFSAFPVAITIYLQTALKSSLDSLSGIPLSDAAGWAACSKFIAFFGEFPINNGGWCDRKPVYPMFFGLLLRFTNNINLTHIIVSILIALASYWAFNESQKYLGFIASLPIMIASSAYWYIWGANQFLTESIGLLFGLLTFTSFLKLVHNLSSVNLISFGAISSLGQIIRPGNILIFAIPLLAIVFSKISIQIKIIKSLIFTGSYLASFLMLQLFATIKNFSNFQNSGNAWSTLYGLQNQNQSWSAAYELPELKLISNDYEKSQIIMEKTIQTVKDNPTKIFVNTLRNIQEMFTTHLPFFSPIEFPAEVFYALLSVLFALIFIYFLVDFLRNHRISPSNRASHFGIIVSTVCMYGVSWKSDPYRALSATQILFIFSCVNVLFIGSQKFIANRKWLRYSFFKKFSITSVQVERNTQENYSRSLLHVSGLTVFVLGLTLVLSFVPQKKLDSLNTTTCLNPESIKIYGAGLQILRSNQIDTNVSYSWSSVIKEISAGYWVSGIAISREKRPTAVSLFLPTPKKLTDSEIQASCFRILPRNINNPNEILGFETIKLESN